MSAADLEGVEVLVARLIAAVSHPPVHILGHPRGRIFGVPRGIRAN